VKTVDLRYAGGEKSGVAIQARPDKKPGQDLVSKIMEQAVNASDHDTKPLEKPKFAGYGNRLGDENTISSSSSSASRAPKPIELPVEEPEKVKTYNHRLKKYSHFGQMDSASVFNISHSEDGPLLRYDVPANQEILSSINSGYNQS
jgi:UBX domain-containing protein 1